MKVVATALMKDGGVFTMPKPARHSDLVRTLDQLGIEPHDWEQGFISDDGTFLTRFRARAVAVRSGQIEKAKWGNELYSEDLW